MDVDALLRIPGAATAASLPPVPAQTSNSNKQEPCIAPKLVQLAELAEFLHWEERSQITLPEVGEDRCVVLRSFAASMNERAESHGPLATGWNLLELARGAAINIETIGKSDPLFIALWVVWLQVTAKHLPPGRLKYQSLDSFLRVYPKFNNESATELIRLMKTANWMNYIFSKIPARKNKGLVLEVVPKFVEGWHVRYITGSGQTQSTRNRVLIFETEGGCKASAKPRPRHDSKRSPPHKRLKLKRAMFGQKRRRIHGYTNTELEDQIEMPDDTSQSNTLPRDTDSDPRPDPDFVSEVSRMSDHTDRIPISSMPHRFDISEMQGLLHTVTSDSHRSALFNPFLLEQIPSDLPNRTSTYSPAGWNASTK